MIPLIWFGGTPAPGVVASRWMKELFSSSIRSGDPPTELRAPTPAPASARPWTSLVDTKPPDVLSSRNTTPLPLITVASPPPPSEPATPPVQDPGTGPEYAAYPPPPWPIHTPAVNVGQDVGVPPVQRSKSAAVSLLWSMPLAV